MKNNSYDEPTTIVFLLGESLSGKDTTGALMVKEHGYTRVSFADAVKIDVANMNNIDVQDLHRQGPIKEKYRSAMIGHAEAERAKDPLIWLKKAFLPYQNEDGHFKKGLKLVVTDCRRESEIDWILQQKEYIHNIEYSNRAQSKIPVNHYLTIRLFLIDRANKPVDQDIITHKCISYALGMHKGLKEVTQVRLMDGIIHNNGTLEQLEAKVEKIVETFKLDHIYKESISE